MRAGEKATDALAVLSMKREVIARCKTWQGDPGWRWSQVWKKVSARTNTNKEKSTALLRFVIVCKGGVAKTPLPKGSGNCETKYVYSLLTVNKNSKVKWVFDGCCIDSSSCFSGTYLSNTDLSPRVFQVPDDVIL